MRFLERNGAWRLAAALALGMTAAPGAAGCQRSASRFLNDLDPAALDEAETVAALGAAGSAPSVFQAAWMAGRMIAEGGLDCPGTYARDGTQYVAGGCTDAAGQVWQGTAEITAADPARGRRGMIAYEEFGSRFPVYCGTSVLQGSWVMSGTLYTMPLDSWRTSFDVDLRVEIRSPDLDGCTLRVATVAYEYAGVRTTDDEWGVAIWNGSGRIGATDLGLVEVLTSDEIIDLSLCPSEPLAGLTILEAGGHESILFYDGERNCSPFSTAAWQYDGVDMGELSGILR